MTVSSTQGAQQPARPDLAGSSANQAANSAGSNTVAGQQASTNTLDLQEIIGHYDFSSLHDTFEYFSLTEPEKEIQDKLLEKIDGTLAKIDSMDAKTVLMDMEAIMGLMLQFAQEMRKNGREVRAANMQASVNLLLAASEEIKKAGEANYKAAMVTSALKIFSGVIQVAASTAAFTQAMKSAQATAAKDKAGAIEAKGKADFINGLAQGMTTILDGIGSMATAGLKLNAAEAESLKAKLEAWSKEKDAISSGGGEDFARAAELIKAVLDALDNRYRASNEINRSIIQNF